MLENKPSIIAWDERRNYVVPGDAASTITFAVEHFVEVAREAIRERGAFYVALSGGSTPKAIYEALCKSPYKASIAWEKVYLFWSDERSVPPDHPDSNYHMAMHAGFKNMPIPSAHIHRMRAEEEIEAHALKYETSIKNALNSKGFDLVMLGMGEDGHTASLFPHTEALDKEDCLVAANYVPQQKSWRMTLTYPSINHAAHSVFYVLGEKKSRMVKKVLQSQERFHDLPAQKVGTPTHPALWILDNQAASDLLNPDE